MKILFTEKDFEDAWQYDKKYLDSENTSYPSSYPCIMEIYTWGGGLGGEGMSHVFINLPADPRDQEQFIAGYKAGQQTCKKYDL